jgi:hypothetical protein
MEKRLTADLNVVANSNLEIQLLDGDLNIIQKLDDEPNDVGGLTSAELKAKFDESGNIIKKYINETLIPAVLTDDATEESRKQAEAARVAAEQGRVTAEEGRVSAETARAAAEQARSEAEASRVSAENARAAAETARADETAGIVARATEQANAAAGSASQAAGSEQRAKDAAGTAIGAASSASQSAAAASGSASQASAAVAAAAGSAAGAETASKAAQSWAVGGTGTRPGEDTDNAKYWARQAQAAAGGDFATKAEAQGYVTTHNESDAAHPDIRAALNDKAAATHASQHGKDGEDPITPDAIGAIASTAKGTAGGVASLGADGKVPASQLPETDTYTKDEILKDATAALLGLGTDAVPDDAFKKIWEQATVSTKKYHVELCNLFLSNVTGIPSNQVDASAFKSALKTNSPDVSNVIIPNDLITIVNSAYYTIYKLSTEEQWHRIEWQADVAVPPTANILFNYDGEYFYMIVGKQSTSSSSNATALELKRTKDFKTFETLGTYYDGSYSIYATPVLYHINGDVYASFRREAASGAPYTYMYCKLDKTSLTFTTTSAEFVGDCCLYGKYSYKLANTSLASGKLTLQKTDVLTGTIQNIQVTATHNTSGTFCIPLYMSGSLYLVLTNTVGIPTGFISSNYTYCLVSHDDGVTFEEYRFDHVLDGGTTASIVLQYNAISAQWYLKNTRTGSIFKFKTGAFEKVDIDAPYFFYDNSMFIALDAETSIGAVEARLGSSASTVLVMAFAFSRDLEMQGVSRLPSIQQLQMSSNTKDIPFDAVATFWIDYKGVVHTFSKSTSTSSRDDAYFWTINQVYVHNGVSGIVVTGSVMPEID